MARSKKVLAAALVLVLAVAAATGAVGTRFSFANAMNFGTSPIGQVMLLPFLPFTSILASQSIKEVLAYSAISGAILIGLVALIVKLDTNYTEASLGASQRMAKRLVDARSGRVTFNRGNAFMMRYSVATLPRLNGAGPIAWHQLTSLLRSVGNLAIFLLVLSAGMMVPILMTDSTVIRQVLAVMIAMSVFLLPQFIQYDFRSEVDRMAVLKALPLRPMAIVCGELLTPISVTLLVQAVMLGVIAVIGGVEPRVLAAISAFLIPANFLIYAVENFVFLMFPFRIYGNGQDLQTVVRIVLTMMLKMSLIAVLGGTAAGLGGLVYYLTQSDIPAFATAWICTVACCAAMLPAISWAFQRFDPASDTP